MIAKSNRYPELRVADAGVKFTAGVAEVPSEDALNVLRRLGHLGVEISEDTQNTDDSTSAGDDTSASTTEVPASPSGSTDETDEVHDDDQTVDTSEWDEDQLRAFATEREIDLGRLQNLDKIRERITEALAA